MALPAGIVTTQITFGTAVAMISTRNLGMTVKFTPTTSLVWAATGTVLIADAEGFTADPGTQGSVTLINPDQAGFSDGNGNTIRNWGYKVEATYTDSGTTLFTAPTKYITWAAADAGPIDLDQMIPVTASSGITVSMPIVTSVNGSTGDVVTAASMTKAALDATYTSLSTAQTITAQHTFQNGLKIGPMVMQPYPTDLTGTVHADFALFLTGGAQIVNESPSGRATRIPFGITADINAATLDPGGKAADKVGAQLNVNFRGDYTNETTIGAVDPGFLWGADDFITTGSSPGDLKGITDLWGRETETHLMAPGVNLGTLKGLHTEVAVEASAVGSHVAMAVGHHITNMKINGSPAGTTVDAWYGLLIEAPLQGTTNYGLYITDHGKARIGGDLEMNADPSQPHTINAYSGSVFGQTVHIGKPTDMPVVSGGESRLAVYAANDTDVVASFAARGNATGDVARFGVGQYVLSRFDHSGRLVLSDILARGAVPDAELGIGEVSITVDGFPMKLNFKGRDNSGAIRTASIALA